MVPHFLLNKFIFKDSIKPSQVHLSGPIAHSFASKKSTPIKSNFFLFSVQTHSYPEHCSLHMEDAFQKLEGLKYPISQSPVWCPPQRHPHPLHLMLSSQGLIYCFLYKGI